MKMLPLDNIIVGERFRKDFGDIQSLAEDIEARGIIQPISVSSDMQLLAGGRRFAAAQQLNMKRIPALVRVVESNIDAREVELVENVMRKDFTWQERAALITEIDRMYKEKEGSNWSGRKTAELLGKSTGGINRSLQISEAAEYLPELMDYKTEDEAFKTLKKAQEQAIIHQMRVQQEDKLVELNDENIDEADKTSQRIFHADNHYNVQDVFEGLTELADLQEQIGQTKISLVEIDPPYGIDLGEQKKRTSNVQDELNNYTDVPKEEYEDFLKRLCTSVYEVTSDNVWVIFWFGPTWFTEVKAALTNAGFEVDDIPGIWTKPSGQTMAPEKYLARAYEPFFIAWKGQPVLKERGRSNVFSFSPVSPAKKFHPTQRPVELMDDLLNTFCYPGSIILVPFLGSGVTLRSAYRLAMTGFGFDLDKKNKDRFLLSLEDDV